MGFWSRSLLPAERNYSTSERECLAVVWAVQILRPYLEGKPFVLYTDHAALRWMFTIADANTRLARWRLRLLEFDFQVKYRKGAENTVADTISRLPTFGHTETPPDLDIPCLLIDEHMKEPPSSHIVPPVCRQWIMVCRRLGPGLQRSRRKTHTHHRV